MGRKPCCSKEEGLNRGAWTAMEDKILVDYIKTQGEGKWRSIPKAAGLKRCGKSCRLRWLNYLRPDIKRGNITNDEEDLIIRLHKLLGNRWSLIAGRLPGRTDNEIKNYWNTVLSKRAAQVKGFDHINKDEKKQRIVSWSRKKGAPLTSTSGTVIHAKAERCSKVFITPQQQQQQQRIIAKDDDNYNVVRTVPSIEDANLVHESAAVAVLEPEPSDGSFAILPSSSASPSKEEHPSWEFIAMDFGGAGENISISEALVSDFDFCDMNSALINDQYGTNDCGGDQVLSLSSSEEMVENYWNGNDCVELEANLDSDFGFLEALLESNVDFNNLN